MPAQLRSQSQEKYQVKTLKSLKSFEDPNQDSDQSRVRVYRWIRAAVKEVEEREMAPEPPGQVD